MKKPTKKATTEYVRHMLSTNSQWALTAVVTILKKNQTGMEQVTGYTREDNGIGFSGVDSKILTSMANQHRNGRQLSEKQMNVLFKLVPKYHKQIINLSDSEKLEALTVSYLRQKKITNHLNKG